MPRVRLKVEPTYETLASISTEFPDDEFRILASHPTEDGLLVVMEIETADPAAIVQHVDDSSEVRSYEVLHTDERIVLVRYVIPESGLSRAARLSGNLPRYPLTLRDGWIIGEMTTSHERLSQFTDQLDAAGVSYQLLSVAQSHDPTALLTDRQRQFVTEAVDRGYYASPRRSTLTDLAAVFDVSNPTASGILHRAEGRIIEEFINEPAV